MSYWNPSGLKVLRGRFSKTMRILITGGFGFVGGRLAVHLAQAGYQIVLGSRNANSPPVWLPQAGELMAYRHDGFWHCMDTKRDHELLESLWAKGAPWAV